MNEKSVIDFLKENLKIELELEKDFGIFLDKTPVVVGKVRLILLGETISESSGRVTING